MKRKVGLFALILTVLGVSIFALVSGRGGSAANSSSNEAITVTASFYPMAEFVRQVGGDNVAVQTLVTPGVEPHDYEPSPQDLVKLRDSALFVYNGAGLEPWVDGITADIPDDSVALVEASQGITLLAKEADEAEEAEGEDHSDELTDPHVWLDPVLAQKQVTNIKDALIAADPANAEAYRSNAEAYVAKLADLNTSFENGLAQCERRSIVTSHQAFTYFAERYNIDIQAIAGLSPEEEPSPKKLAEVAEFARQNNVTYIFFETLASPKLSETIAREVGAQSLVLNPLEGLTDDEVADDATYISVQTKNLENLRLAMGCN